MIENRAATKDQTIIKIKDLNKEDLIKKIIDEKEKIIKIEQEKKLISEIIDITKKIKEKDEITNQIKLKDDNYQNANVTVDVYQNAFLVTLKSITNEKFGFGINNYATAFDKYTPENMQVDNKTNSNLRNIFSSEIGALNRSDGRANFFKLITEFGVFSIIFIFYCIYFTISKKISFKEKTFLVPLIATSMISAAGYFNAGFILGVGMMIAATINYKKI